MGCPFCGSSVQCLIPEDMIKGSHRSDILTGRDPLKQKFRCVYCNAVMVKKDVRKPPMWPRRVISPSPEA